MGPGDWPVSPNLIGQFESARFDIAVIWTTSLKFTVPLYSSSMVRACNDLQFIKKETCEPTWTCTP